MANGDKSYTTAGNIRAPDKLLCLEWVKKAWAAVTSEVVIRSFTSCGISVKTDGSEDHLIHCTKTDGIAASAAGAVAEGTAQLNTLAEHEPNPEDDPFADLDSEEDETVIDDE